MSFELTPEERRRVAFAALAGIKLDPIGHADLATIVLLSIVYTFDLCAIAFLLWNRNYAPLKSKYPILMSLCLVGMFVWFLGDLVLKSHVHVVGPVLSNCMLFCVWMRVVFGCFFVSALISIRSYALFCIFRRNRAFRGKYAYFSSGIAAFAALMFILVTYMLPKDRAVFYIPFVQMCSMSYTYRAIVQGLLWMTWVINAFINYRLRHITSSFNESREMGVACVCVLLLITYITVILYVYPLYPTAVSLRVSETVISHVITNFLWWFIMYIPMYNCAFRREEYLAQWKDKLVKDGLQKQYQISRTDPFSDTMISVSCHPTKLVTLPRGMAADGYNYDTRMSFSRPSVNNPNPSGAAGGAERIWYSNSDNQRCGSILSSDSRQEDERSNIVLFSPQRVNVKQLNHLENMSSATTVHDDCVDLSRYHFPTPGKQG